MDIQSPVIITGMHRSGTTMLTKALEKAGLFTGIKHENNSESIFFHNINRWILTQSNTSWDFPDNFKYVNDHFRKQISRVSNFQLSSLHRIKYLGVMNAIKYQSIRNLNFPWGWKDPANSITLPIWKNIFPNAPIINIYRNPIDVAVSLKKREIRLEKNFKISAKFRFKEYFLNTNQKYNQSYYVFDLENNIKLWKYYVALNIKNEEYFPQKFLNVKYEDFIANPIDQLKKVTDFINLPVSEIKLTSIVGGIEKNRSFSFLNTAEYVALYNKVKHDEMIVKLGYGNIT